MTVVGSAEILILPVARDFEKALREQTAPGLKTFQKESQDAGALAGQGLRRGVSGEASKLEADLGVVGSASGASLRRGVSGEKGSLADDVAKVGARAGEGLSKGFGGGLSKLASALSVTGLPLGALSTGLERSGSEAERLGSHSDRLGGKLDHLGGVAMAGVAASAVVLGGAALDVGVKMQGAEASIAAASGTSVAAAAKIGSAFTDTAFKSEFSAIDMAKAFGAVAGQLKATEGHALNSAQAMRVMTAADELATAKQIDLGTATSAVAGVMQAFSLKTRDASHVSDVLFQTSVATGQGVDTLAAQLEKVRSKLGDTGGSVGDLSALLVDMTDRGITGRAAMSALNTSFNTLQKTATGVQSAVQAQKTAFDGLSPQVQKLAKGYLDGSISSKQFTADTSGLSTQQAALVSQFTTANKAVETAQQKYKNLGVTVFDQRGQFVGMRDIIEQLHGRFADMTQQQQLAAAATLFGAGAARQMVAIISAGPAAYDKASASVNKMGAAHAAAEKQSQTLKVELETLKAGAIDLAAKIGAVLIPIVTSMIGWFTKATSFVLDHKAVLIALGVVITSILGPAIAVFTINKMAGFVSSFKDASGHVKSFASDVESVVHRVIAAFTKQNAAAKTMGSTAQAQSAKASTAVKGQASDTEASAAKVEGASAKAGAAVKGQAGATEGAATKIGTAEGAIATETTAATTTVEGDNAAAGTSYAGVASAAGTAAGEVGGAEATLTGEVAAADTTIETDNAAAAASFEGIAVAAGLAGGAGAAGVAGIIARFASAARVVVPVAGVVVGANLAAKYLEGHGILPHPSPSGPTKGETYGGAPSPHPSLPTPGAPISGGGNIITDILGLFNAQGGIPHHATGALAKATGNRITQPTYMVGEEGSSNPEFVIATNPQYRGRNVGLWAEAGKMMGIQGFAAGGVPGWSASQDAVAAQLMRIFRAGGLSAAGAAGMIGNWMQESSLNPSSPGGYLAQWAGSRLTAEQSYAAAHHESPTSVAAQAGFALQELQGYGTLLKELRTTNDASRAALDISNVYERPATATANLPNREGSATAAVRAFASGSAVPVHVVKVAPEYVNPLGRAKADVGRTDQGKDWENIKGPIQAIGQGIITTVYQNLPGFGQTVIEKLTSGSHKGEYLYYAMESGGRATIKSGAHVKAGTTIGYGLGTGGVEFGEWNPNTGHAMGYVPGVTSGAPTAAGTAYASWVASLPSTAAPTTTTVPSPGPTPAQIAAEKLAKARAFVAQEIARESASVDREIKAIRAGLKPHHPHSRHGIIDPLSLVPATARHTVAAHGEIDALTAALHIQIEAQKMSVGEKTVVTKEQLAKQSADLKSGAALFATMAAAVHSGKMSELVASLSAAHKEHLGRLEKALSGDQGAALARLSRQLIMVHMEAQRGVATGQVRAIREMLEPKHVTTLSASGHFGTRTVHATALEREAGRAGIAETKAGLHIHLQEQRRALGEHTGESKKELHRQSADLGKGAAEMAKLVAAVHSGKMGEIKAALIQAHDAHLSELEHHLHGDHSAALQKLNSELKAVHARAMAQFVADSKAQAKAAAAATAAAAAAAATRAQAASDATVAAHLSVVGARAQAQAARIADATKLYLDRQAETGLTGAALTAAKAQVAYDLTVQSADAAIGADQVKVAQAAATGSAHDQALAAAELARDQDAALVAEAQAQAALEKAAARAQAQAQDNGGSSTPPPSPGPDTAPDVFNDFTIIGQGLDANGIMTEITWALKTGTLPVSPPLATVPG